jgi:hypothetical protein
VSVTALFDGQAITFFDGQSRRGSARIHLYRTIRALCRADAVLV